MKGGAAVLMTLDYLRNHHYPQSHREIGGCCRLAQRIYELIRLDSYDTTELRRAGIAQFGCTNISANARRSIKAADNLAAIPSVKSG
jgi:hypothetical protein